MWLCQRPTEWPTANPHEANTRLSLMDLWAAVSYGLYSPGNGSAGHMDQGTVLMPETNAPVCHHRS